MKLPLKVTVTTHDIKTGHPFEPRSCPIANALRRVSGEHLVFACRNGEAIIGGEKFSLPKKVENFMDEFDHNPEQVRRNMPEFIFIINNKLPLGEGDTWLFQGLKAKK
jgi:hypothetical protein